MGTMDIEMVFKAEIGRYHQEVNIENAKDRARGIPTLRKGGTYKGD